MAASRTVAAACVALAGAWVLPGAEPKTYAAGDEVRTGAVRMLAHSQCRLDARELGRDDILCAHWQPSRSH